MVYTLVLWASVRLAPSWLERAGLRLSGSLSALTLLVAPWLVLAAGRLALRPWFDMSPTPSSMTRWRIRSTYRPLSQERSSPARPALGLPSHGFG
jgi:hypothetical protein